MAWAAIIGSTVGFTNYYNSVFIETSDGRARVVERDTFKYLYQELDEFTAALKEDCIQYVKNEFIVDEYQLPDWYLNAISDGVIYGSCGLDMFYPESGEEIPINHDSVILRNYKGELRYMEWNEFTKYYDMPGSEFID